MKIQGKSKDFYDSALGSFMESDIVFQRKQEHILLSKNDVPSLGKDFYMKVSIPKKYKSNRDFPNDMSTVVMIGFCGKWYYGIYSYGGSGLGKFNRCYLNHLSKEENDKIKNEINKELEVAVFEPQDTTYDEVHWLDFDEIRTMIAHGSLTEEFFYYMAGSSAEKAFVARKDIKDPSKTEFWKDEIFEKYGPVILALVPCELKAAECFLLEPRIHIFRNPILKNFKFAKVKDSFTALYEINNWLDSHARPDEAQVPVGDDITRLQAYGFDKKTSFRKCKEKK